MDLDATDDTPAVQALFASLKAALPDLEKLLHECSGEWGYEDPIYRLYHQSFKVYALLEMAVWEFPTAALPRARELAAIKLD